MDKEVLEKIEVAKEKEIELAVKAEEKSSETNLATEKEEKAVVKEEKEKVKQEAKKEEKKESLSEYLASFKNLTLKDVKQEEVKEEETQKIVEDELEEKVSETEPEIMPTTKEKKTTLIIEKPNYDLMSKKKGAVKKKRKFKTALLACALAVCSIGCVAGAVVCDNMNAHYMQLEDSYNLNLLDYLNKINNLNATNKGFEFIETYPEEINEISSIGESTNWFDNLTNFITGLFGG